MEISPMEPQPLQDDDMADWLEMTGYYSEEYRQRRLSRFRRKKELDAARAELDREDQEDLEQHTHRAHTTASPSELTPKIPRRASIATITNPTRMPPPPLPLPLREASNNDRTTDFPLSQASTPTLKRQHAELDTDTHPAEKHVRTTESNGIRTRGSSPTTSYKADPQSARYPPRPPPLEDRMTRRASDFDRHNPPPRRRSPSPVYPYRRPDSRDRRRSYSPRPRLRDGNPGLERPYQKPCFKCNKPDHQQKDCPLVVRRDSRDEKVPAAGYREAPGGFPVSSNYKGRNPRPFAEVKNAGTVEKLPY